MVSASKTVRLSKELMQEIWKNDDMQLVRPHNSSETSDRPRRVSAVEIARAQRMALEMIGKGKERTEGKGNEVITSGAAAANSALSIAQSSLLPRRSADKGARAAEFYRNRRSRSRNNSTEFRSEHTEAMARFKEAQLDMNHLHVQSLR